MPDSLGLVTWDDLEIILDELFHEMEGRYGSKIYVEESGRICLDISYEHQLALTPWRKSKLRNYLIVFHQGYYLWELNLARILINNGKYSWSLSRPRNKENITKFRNSHLKQADLTDPQRKTIAEQHLKLFNSTYQPEIKHYPLVEQATLKQTVIALADIIELFTKPASHKYPRPQRSNFVTHAPEGNSIDLTGTSFSRDPRLRKACLRRDQNTCQSCGFHKMSNGKVIIHVHHKHPLRGPTTTTLDDLICLCPNCHMVAHSKGRHQTYSLEEIKKKVASP